MRGRVYYVPVSYNQDTPNFNSKHSLISHHSPVYELTENSLWFTATSTWFKFCLFIWLATVFWINYNLNYSFMSESNECSHLPSCLLHLLSRRVSSELNSEALHPLQVQALRTSNKTIFLFARKYPVPHSCKLHLHSNSFNCLPCHMMSL